MSTTAGHRDPWVPMIVIALGRATMSFGATARDAG